MSTQGDLADLTADDVADWLGEQGFAQYQDAWRASGLAGPDLPALTAETLQERVGITSAFHCRTIINKASRLLRTYGVTVARRASRRATGGAVSPMKSVTSSPAALETSGVSQAAAAADENSSSVHRDNSDDEDELADAEVAAVMAKAVERQASPLAPAPAPAPVSTSTAPADESADGATRRSTTVDDKEDVATAAPTTAADESVTATDVGQAGAEVAVDGSAATGTGAPGAKEHTGGDDGDDAASPPRGVPEGAEADGTSSDVAAATTAAGSVAGGAGSEASPALGPGPAASPASLSPPVSPTSSLRAVTDGGSGDDRSDSSATASVGGGGGGGGGVPQRRRSPLPPSPQQLSIVGTVETDDGFDADISQTASEMTITDMSEVIDAPARRRGSTASTVLGEDGAVEDADTASMSSGVRRGNGGAGADRNGSPVSDKAKARRLTQSATTWHQVRRPSSGAQAVRPAFPLQSATAAASSVDSSSSNSGSPARLSFGGSRASGALRSGGDSTEDSSSDAATDPRRLTGKKSKRLSIGLRSGVNVEGAAMSEGGLHGEDEEETGDESEGSGIKGRSRSASGVMGGHRSRKNTLDHILSTRAASAAGSQRGSSAGEEGGDTASDGDRRGGARDGSPVGETVTLESEATVLPGTPTQMSKKAALMLGLVDTEGRSLSPTNEPSPSGSKSARRMSKLKSPRGSRSSPSSRAGSVRDGKLSPVPMLSDSGGAVGRRSSSMRQSHSEIDVVGGGELSDASSGNDSSDSGVGAGHGRIRVVPGIKVIGGGGSASSGPTALSGLKMIGGGPGSPSSMAATPRSTGVTMLAVGSPGKGGNDSGGLLSIMGELDKPAIVAAAAKRDAVRQRARETGVLRGHIALFDEPDDRTNIVLQMGGTPGAMGGGDGTSDREVVMAGTVEKVVQRLSYPNFSDPVFVQMWLLTFRAVVKPREMLRLLRMRFLMQPPDEVLGDNADAAEAAASNADGSGRDSPMGAARTDAYEEWCQTVRKVVRLRVYNVLKSWLDTHFADFQADEQLCDDMREVAELLRENGMAMPATQLCKLLDSLDDLAERRRNLTLQYSGKPPAPKIPHNVRGDRLEFGDVDPVEAARQLTLVEQRLFRRIESKELFRQGWMSAEKERVSPNIIAYIDHFNKGSVWLMSQILKCETLKSRVAMVQRILRVGQMFLDLNNFCGVMLVLGCMQAQPVYRLRHTWAELPKKSTETLQRIREVGSSDRSYKVMRGLLATLNPPAIPHCGLYLTDMTHVSDGNDDYVAGDMINVNKLRLMSRVMLDIQVYQQTPYAFEPLEFVQDAFLSEMGLASQVWGDKYAHEQSLKLEPRGAGRPTTPTSKRRSEVKPS